MAVISTVLVPSVLRLSLIVNVDPVTGNTQRKKTVEDVIKCEWLYSIQTCQFRSTIDTISQ